MNILTLKGYFDRFHEMRKYYKTHKETWEALEAEMFEEYGINRYSSFESFESNFYRWINFRFRQIG